MMKAFIKISVSMAFLWALASCRSSPTYEKYSKELDSLKIVVEQAVDHFKTVDSMACYQTYAKQYSYSAFISAHLKDTVTKTVAENLQAFATTGKPMNNYLVMRPQWLLKASLSLKQLASLSHDLKAGSIEPTEAVEFITLEKEQAENRIEELKVNTESIRHYLDVYANSLPVVEETIKHINGGSLPETSRPVITHTL